MTNIHRVLQKSVSERSLPGVPETAGAGIRAPQARGDFIFQINSYFAAWCRNKAERSHRWEGSNFKEKMLSRSRKET